MTDTSQEEVVAPEANEGEGREHEDVVKVSREEYEKMNQTLGSLKREIKDLRKPKEEPKETPDNKTKPDESRLLDKLEKMSLRSAGISHPEDVELARTIAKKWNMDIDDVLEDEDFKLKLERQQTNRTNIQATSGVRGSGATSQAKNTTAYWQAKGVPPSPEDIPDRKIRQKIVKEIVRSSKKGLSGNPYYNG